MSLDAMAVGGVSAYYSYGTEKEREAARDEYNEELKKEAIRQYGELDEAESDIIYESHAKSLEAQKALLYNRSARLLQAAGTGTYGSSVDVALKDMSRGYAYNISEITDNRDRSLQNVNKTAERIKLDTRMRTDRTILQPAWFTAAMTGLNTANSYTQAKNTFKESQSK